MHKIILVTGGAGFINSKDQFEKLVNSYKNHSEYKLYLERILSERKNV